MRYRESGEQSRGFLLSKGEITMDMKQKYAHIQYKLDEISRNTPTSYERFQETNRRFKQRSKLWLLARRNTMMNSSGQTLLTKDSPYRNEYGWESDIKEW